MRGRERNEEQGHGESGAQRNERSETQGRDSEGGVSFHQNPVDYERKREMRKGQVFVPRTPHTDSDLWPHMYKHSNQICTATMYIMTSQIRYVQIVKYTYMYIDS